MRTLRILDLILTWKLHILNHSPQLGIVVKDFVDGSFPAATYIHLTYIHPYDKWCGIIFIKLSNSELISLKMMECVHLIPGNCTVSEWQQTSQPAVTISGNTIRPISRASNNFNYLLANMFTLICNHGGARGNCPALSDAQRIYRYTLFFVYSMEEL